jgi:hypothetical protein
MKLSIAITTVVESYARPSKAFPVKAVRKSFVCRSRPLLLSGPVSKACSALGPVETSAVQERMPVILDPDAYDLWLDPGIMNVRAASEPGKLSMPD